MAKGKSISGAVKGFEKTFEVYRPSLLKEIDNSSLAATIAGTSDKKSKAYKAAMRNVQRWKKGTTKPKEASQKKVVDRIRKSPELKQKLFKPDRPIKVTLDAKITYSSDKRRPRSLTAKFSPDEAQKFFELSRQDKEIAQDFFFTKYGFNPEEVEGARWSITEVE